MRASIGQGVDRLSPTGVERQPDASLQELSDIHAAVEESLCWPVQTQLVIGHMTPKHRGDGDRVIGLTSMFSRVWSQARGPQVTEWSRTTAPGWDAAEEGNAALREAFIR
eukprot:8575230-Pyramimonas_sp.AAC.1